MKRTIITIILSISLFTFGCHSLYAQARLSTSDDPVEPDPSAMLEVDSDHAGLLLPRVTLTMEADQITAPGIPVIPADGLIIFNDGTGGPTKGLWYYDATIHQWILYSDFTSVHAQADLDNFGELYESNDLGAGSPYLLEDNFHIPWESATEGLSGSAFEFLDSYPVTTEIGVDYPADRFQIAGDDAIYSVVISATLAASAPSTTVTGILFKNNFPVEHLFFRHTFQLKDNPTSLNTSGNIEIISGDIIDFRFISSVKNKGIEVENMNIRLSKLGDL